MKEETRNLLAYTFMGLSLILMILALYLVFIWVPTEQSMGIVQRIFYFHVPSAWVGFLAFFVVFIASILYLWRGGMAWDRLASSSAEIGMVFTTLVLLTGPIWAKPTWGIWWTWDIRLTLTLVLWLIYLAYLMVRSYATEASQGARFSAVIGIIGFLDVPLVFMAIRWWRTQHPSAVVETGGIDSSMLITLMVCLVAFTTLYIILLLERVGLKQAADEIDSLRQTLRD